MGAKKDSSPLLQLRLTLSAPLLTGDHSCDHLRDQGADLSTRGAEGDADDDLSALAIGGDVALTALALDDANGWILGKVEAKGLASGLTVRTPLGMVRLGGGVGSGS
jgi:hypothetical protein